MRKEKRIGRLRIGAFTLVELIVVISILAVLATIGFLSISGYTSDAKDAAVKSNVRSVYSAIVSESALTGNSPRYYVVHDPSYALSWGIVVFDGNSTSLAGGDWNQPGTNYSAGNPDYQKLKINREKFKITRSEGFISEAFPGLRTFAATAADPTYLLVWAVDVTKTVEGKPKVRSYWQVAWLLPSKTETVMGDYPSVGYSGVVLWLVRDLANPSSTGALVDKASAGWPPACAATTMSWYAIPDMASGFSQNVSKAVPNGTLNASAVCTSGTVTLVSESAACVAGYVPWAGPSCVADVCGNTVPTHASSTATSQTVTLNWHYSATPAQCTFACDVGYSWDGSSCRADCQIPAVDSYSGLSYAISPLWTLPHGWTTNRTGTSSFGSSPNNGTLVANFAYSCNDGTVSKTATGNSGTCQSWYVWNSNWTAPACSVAPYVFNYAISGNVANFNLKNQAIAAGWNQTAPLSATVTINAWVVVYGSSPSNPAFTVGSLPTGSSVTIVNNGYVYGAWGNGGNGNGNGGWAWGDAISLGGAYAVTVNNTNGYVYWGGGGGGGWAVRTNTNVLAWGGGGGGGQGYVGGAGGAGGDAYAWAQYPYGYAGWAGNSSWAGGGWSPGNSWYYPNQWAGWYCIAGVGWAGGGWWTAGVAWGVGSGSYCPDYTPWNGWAGGYAVRKNWANVTFTGGNNVTQVRWNVN